MRRIAEIMLIATLSFASWGAYRLECRLIDRAAEAEATHSTDRNAVLASPYLLMHRDPVDLKTENLPAILIRAQELVLLQ